MAVTVIASNSNLTLRVIVHEMIKNDQGKYKKVKHEGRFAVDRGSMTKHSNFFTRMLSKGTFKEGSQSEITIEDDSLTSVETWLKIIHGFTPAHDVTIVEVWRVLVVGHKYDFPVNLLDDWFAAWYKATPKDWIIQPGIYDDKDKDPACLLYPCLAFDHAEGFMEVSKHLVYNCVGHIAEAKPIIDMHLHLPARVIQQLNAARGRLRTVIFNPIYKPIKDSLNRNRKCCDKSACDYQRALLKTEAWPLEEMGTKKPMKRILWSLDKFSHFQTTSDCTHFGNGAGVVHGASDRARYYFDGLCLDCMDLTNPKTSSSDEDYWKHQFLGEDASVECRRRKHTQPTWYFSFMGRKEEQPKFRREGLTKRGKEAHQHANAQVHQNVTPIAAAVANSATSGGIPNDGQTPDAATNGTMQNGSATNEQAHETATAGPVPNVSSEGEQQAENGTAADTAATTSSIFGGVTQ